MLEKFWYLEITVILCLKELMNNIINGQVFLAIFKKMQTDKSIVKNFHFVLEI